MAADLLLPDGEPFSCHMMLRDDAPVFWYRCPRNAQAWLGAGERVRFEQWHDEHPKAVLSLYPGKGDTGLCSIHLDVVRELL